MCGIVGWMDLKADISSEQRTVERMTETLISRGPDAFGYWHSPHALLGHRRLSVVDLLGGSQPMVRTVGEYQYVITYNGELYNTVELRCCLEDMGYVFRSTSDTEVLLISYMEWGTDCLSHLNGIFAFGIWDGKEQRLFLARDRFGVKPLFYARRNTSMIFASELKALLAHPMVQPEIDHEGLAEIFALGPARTPGHGVFKGVLEVKPAHYLLCDASGVHSYHYWSLESHPHRDNLEETTAIVRELIQDAIQRQLVADVPVCTFLSGGLDSSAITAIAANHFQKMGLGPLHTFSVDYAENDKYFKASSFQPNSDTHWIQQMTQTFGTQHHSFMVETDQLADALVEATLARDLPGMADIDASLLLFCREIKKSHVVSLSGECADEVFGGYPWFHDTALLNTHTFPWAKSMEDRLYVLSNDLIHTIRPQEYVERRYHETLAQVPVLYGEPPLEARRREMFYLNINWFMSTLLDRKDRMSMASGLEVRVPFCDHRLVEYVWNIPWEMKMLEGREKGIMRNALSGLLPTEVLYRKKSPYPKTHHPAYETAVKTRLLEIINDNSSPLLPLIDFDAIYSLSERESDLGKPWFGQLMSTPQLFAYLIQADTWLRHYKVKIV